MHCLIYGPYHNHMYMLNWRYVALVQVVGLYTVASGVVGVGVGVVVVVVGVCNRSQMRTSIMYMFNFWCEYRS